MLLILPEKIIKTLLETLKNLTHEEYHYEIPINDDFSF